MNKRSLYACFFRANTLELDSEMNTSLEDYDGIR